MTSAAVEILPFVTFADYLAFDEASEVRHEWVGGRAYVMAGDSERHGLMTTLIAAALTPGALAAGCRPFQEGRRLYADRAAYYPDVLIVSGPRADEQHENDASLIVEVASPSTRGIDKREKATAYRSLPGLEQYVLVDPDRLRVESGVPTADGWRWNAHGPGDVVFTPYGVLHLDELYAAIDAVATRQTE